MVAAGVVVAALGLAVVALAAIVVVVAALGLAVEAPESSGWSQLGCPRSALWSVHGIHLLVLFRFSNCTGPHEAAVVFVAVGAVALLVVDVVDEADEAALVAVSLDFTLPPSFPAGSPWPVIYIHLTPLSLSLLPIGSRSRSEGCHRASPP